MKWELDDNTRSGLHYLVLGLAIVAALRFGWLGLYSFSYRDVPNEERIFRHGYLGLASITTVVTRHTPLERLFAALGVACAVSIAVAVIVALFKRSGRSSRFRAMFWFGFILASPWAIWSSLICPGKSAFFKQDALLLRYHTTIVMDLPLPFTESEQGLDRSEVIGLSARRGTVWSQSVEHVSEIVLETRYGTEVIGVAWVNENGGRHSIEAVDWLSNELVERLRSKLGPTGVHTGDRGTR